MSCSIYNSFWVSDKQSAHTWDGCMLIVLPCGRQALFDIENLPLIQGQTWRAQPSSADPENGTHYCVYTKNRKPLKPILIRMHHVILNLPSSVKVDHRDGNGLDNRRHNLRPASDGQNMQNRRKLAAGHSRFKGVSRDRWGWTSSIGTWPHERWFLGHFDNEEAAARAYDVAARERFGEFARVNFPAPHEQPAIQGDAQ